MVDGLLLIDKAAGPTSHDVVNSARRILKQKRIGHTGTLDPAATGLLVIMLGKATRLAQWLSGVGKVYEGTILLGRATTTGDAAGEIIADKACDITVDQVLDAAQTFIGEISQTPPAYSAVKINGTPAYAIARKGGQVALKSRIVTIKEFDVAPMLAREPCLMKSEGGHSYSLLGQESSKMRKESPHQLGNYPIVSFKVSCSSGTYIRSLAVDLGAELGCPAHLATLRRLSCGKFSVEAAISMSRFSGLDEEERAKRIIPMREAIEAPEVFPLANDMVSVRDGVRFAVSAAESPRFGPSEADETHVKIIHPTTGELFGLGKVSRSEDKLFVKPFLILAR